MKHWYHWSSGLMGYMPGSSPSNNPLDILLHFSNRGAELALTLKPGAQVMLPDPVISVGASGILTPKDTGKHIGGSPLKLEDVPRLEAVCSGTRRANKDVER